MNLPMDETLLSVSKREHPGPIVDRRWQGCGNCCKLILNVALSLKPQLRMQAGKSQLESGKLVRLVALACIVLALLMAGVEATHSHADAVVASNSSPCVICLSVHAKAPAVTVYLLLVFHSVEAFTIPYETQGKSAISELSLFIRPPPAA
jgi:hypothetical protein